MLSSFSDHDHKMLDLIDEIQRNFVRTKHEIVQKISPIETFMVKIRDCCRGLDNSEKESLKQDLKEINLDNYEEILKNVFYKYIPYSLYHNLTDVISELIKDKPKILIKLAESEYETAYFDALCQHALEALLLVHNEFNRVFYSDHFNSELMFFLYYVEKHLHRILKYESDHNYLQANYLEYTTHYETPLFIDVHKLRNSQTLNSLKIYYTLQSYCRILENDFELFEKNYHNLNLSEQFLNWEYTSFDVYYEQGVDEEI